MIQRVPGHCVAQFPTTYSAPMRPKAFAIGAVVGMLIVGSLVAAPPASNAEFTAPIALSRTSGPVGTQVGVTGNGFEPFAAVDLRWDSPTGAVLANGSATPNGTISLTFTVPTSSTGQKAVVVCQTSAPCGSPKNNLHRGGFAYFTVTTKPPPSTTTTTTTSTPSSTAPPSSSLPVAPPSSNGAIEVKAGPGSIVGDGVWGPVYVPNLNRPIIPDEGLAPRCTATPSSTIVDFDDVADGTDIREAYSSLGVRFTAVQHDDSTTPRPDVPVTARSWLDQGSVSEPNIARLGWSETGRQRSAIRLDFDRPQRVIGLHVGAASNYPTEFELFVPGTSVNDVVSLVGGAPTPVSTCMLIVVPEGTTTATIRVNYEALLIDRVFFSEENDFVTPEVISGSVIIQAPYASASGRISVSAPHEIVGWAPAVFGPGETTPRRYEAFYVSYVNDRGTGVRHTFAPWRASGTGQAWSVNSAELPRGPFRISVVAVGPGVVARAVKDFVGFTDEELLNESARSFDIVPIGMEVTQGLSSGFIPGTPGGTQTGFNVDIAGRATVVRAFARLVRAPGSPNPEQSRLPVRAWLLGFSGGRLLPGSPLTAANNTIALSERDLARDLDAMRTSTSAGWNFHLPLSWTKEGDIRLMLWVNPPGASQLPEAAVPGSGLNTITLNRQRFEAIDPRATTLYLVHAFWRENGEIRNAKPTLAELNTAINRWEQLFPVPYGGISISGAVVKRWAFRPCVEEETVRENACSDGPVPDVPIWDNNEIVAEQPDAIASGRAAFIPVIFSPASLIGCSGRAGLGGPPIFHGGACGTTLAQEAGHSLGLIHLSTAHDELTGGDAFNRFDGDHGEMEQDAVGWDLATDTAVLRTDGAGHRHDFMSYGGGTQYVTLDTWNKVAVALRESNYLSNTEGPDIRAGSSRATADIKTLIVTVRVSDDSVTLSPVSRTSVAIAPSAPIANPAVEIRVSGTSGTNAGRMLTGAFTHDLQIWTPEYTVAVDDPGGALRIEVIDAATKRVLKTFENVQAVEASPPSQDEVASPATMPIIRTIGGDAVTPPNRTVRFDADAPGGLDGLTIAWLINGEPRPEYDGQSSIDVGAPVGTHRVTLQLSDGKNTGSVDHVFVIDEDADRDGLGDTFEQQYRLDPQSPNDAVLDGDADGLDNVTEQRWGTDPTKADSDSDRYRDDTELAGGSDPNDPASLPVALHSRLGEPVPMIGEGATTTTDTVASSNGDDGSPLLGVVITLVALVVLGGGAAVIVVRRRARGRTTTG